jgi:hypothetical protein
MMVRIVKRVTQKRDCYSRCLPGYWHRGKGKEGERIQGGEEGYRGGYMDTRREEIYVQKGTQ